MRGLYGLRRPGGVDWWALLPVAVAGGLVGGVWIPAVPLPTSIHAVPPWYDLTAMLALPVAAEAIFRGLFHGSLVTSFPIQTRGARWLLSWPVFLSAVVFAFWGAVLRHPFVALALPVSNGVGVPVSIVGAVVFGVAAGMARERSESIASAILFHWIAVAAALLLHPLGPL